MERFADQAFVLSTVDYGEADRLVTLFTLGRGRLTAFAAGARKSKRRFAGALEPFTLITAQLVERRGDTFRLDGADIQRGFFPVRQDLGGIARALYAVDLCRALTRDQEPYPQLFALLLAYLEGLERRGTDGLALLGFELAALAQVGLQPRFGDCAVCAGPLGEAPGFDPEHGGAVCFSCRPRRSALGASKEVFGALASLQRGQLATLAPLQRRHARGLIEAFIAHQLGKRLKSAEFLAQVGADE